MKQKRIILIGYKIGSRSLKNLQTNLKEVQTDRRVLRVRKNSVRYKRRPSDKLVTWGPIAPCVHMDAAQEAAKYTASNKLDFFRLVTKWNSDNVDYPNTHVNLPEWTTNVQVAQSWGKDYLARTLLRSHSGKGIVIVPAGEVGPNAKLYVQYKKKKYEYRVHVFQSQVIDITQKKKRVDHEGTNHQIRNHQNGWVYCRENIQEPEGIRELALAACNAISLLSGAVDIIWNEKENKCYVLEINTAPGIEGTTCSKYTQSILESLV